MSVEAQGPDLLVGLKTDLLRGSAAYSRDESDDLLDSARALRAKGELLRRHFRELQKASAALKAESDQLRRQIQSDRQV